MAQVFPDFENIARLKVKPTSGELHLLHALSTNLNDDFEVYFQPMLNGDMPDIILMKKGCGVAIVEVKDWNLDAYHIDENNNWHENQGGHKIRSPFQQAFGYKKNLFDLHINGLAEKKLMNSKFYGSIKVFVYFHNSDKTNIETIFNRPTSSIQESRFILNLDLEQKKIEYGVYTKQMDYLQIKSEQIDRDMSMSIHKGNTIKLFKSIKYSNILFDDNIYEEFKRYMKPPFHVADEGISIIYDITQTKLTVSSPGFQKIKGVAGSGKTTVLAKKAVNAHKRHNDNVLILTYNKTLRNFIHDKISAVREDFSWRFFQISNYHSFISQALNTCGIKIDPPDDRILAGQDMEKLYADENLFDGTEAQIYKYKTILIDEIQDYQSEWIKIIRKYFLETDGEMVLFGDDSQNIYSRNLTKRDLVLVRGFNRWEKLKKSYRTKNYSLIFRLSRSFKTTYLEINDDIDSIDLSQGDLELEMLRGYHLLHQVDADNAVQIFESISEFIKENQIHPNDVCIISSRIELLRKVDSLIKDHRNEKTQTTFETEEQFTFITSHLNVSSNKKRQELETIRGGKKFRFQMNSGLIKLSTIHSFKGMEASTVIYILSDRENDEMIYTGITRAKRNLLMFFPKNNPRMAFFEDHISIE